MTIGEARDREDPMKIIKEIQDNVKSIKKQVDGLKP